jgi:hypothetical protein
MNRKTSVREIPLAHEQEADERVILQAEIGSEITYSHVLIEAIRDLVQHDGDIDVAFFAQLIEQQVRGRVFAFERKSYTLSDGTQILRAEGKPKDNP